MPSTFAISTRLSRYWKDVLICLVISTTFGGITILGNQSIDSAVYQSPVGYDLWFQADIPRVYQNMTSRGSDHNRSNMHPLFSLIIWPPVALLKLLISNISAVRIVMTSVSILWVASFYCLLRLVGCRRLDASLFSALAASSAAAMFWFVVPETHKFGSLTIILSLCFLALTQRRKFSYGWYVAVSALTMSMTISNWMFGVLIAAVKHRWRKAAGITAVAACVVFALCIVQRYIFASAQFPILNPGGTSSVLNPLSGGPAYVTSGFLFDSVIFPEIEVSSTDAASDITRLSRPILSVQKSMPGTGSVFGLPAIALQLILMGLGVYGIFARARPGPLPLVVVTALLGQWLLHVLYGEETFLYALNWVPLIILVCAYGSFTPVRRSVLALTLLLTLVAIANNRTQFNRATALLSHLARANLELINSQQRPAPGGSRENSPAGVDTSQPS